ncbi:MAG: FecR domain-containing protein, partial [Bryobacteraceae bacterium]|nr:FecR domain-containing protein [Bryobacteraceae bacterium]
MKRWALAFTFGTFGMFAQEDQPGRGVARLSLINGEVSVKRGDSGDLVAAAVNAPLVVQDRVLTGPTSRAELQFDFANFLRLGSVSEVRLNEVEYRRYMVQIARGTVTWRVMRDNASDVDISTPSVSVRPVEWGDYRVTVHDDGTTEVTVRRGEAEIFSPRGTQRLRAGQTMLARGTQTDPEFRITAAVAEDEFDRWNLRRDRDYDRSQSRQHMAQDILGWEELDQHGAWVNVAPYGMVWRPRVAAGWAPYRHGRWVWMDWYGWSWVSHDPFGWAPFHHGNWFWHANNWCWWPGGFGRSWWRPAVVSWFGWGGGGGFNVGVGFGPGWGLGWVPLAPFERFRPWYGPGFYRGWGAGGFGNTTIVNNTRIINNYNIINNYRNARVDGAVNGIAAEQFGRIGSGEYQRVSQANLRSAGLVEGAVPAAPARESLAYGGRILGGGGNESGIRG